MTPSCIARVALSVALIAGCDALPGRPREADRPLRPSQVKDFARLYSENCSGCHGADGQFGPALALHNPVYLKLAADSHLRHVIAQGMPHTAMPPFARFAGGALTDEQIEVLINGMRQQWTGPEGAEDTSMPAYRADTAGDADRGRAVYGASCSSCHGPDGTGTAAVGSIVDPSYLALVSNQGLRSLVIAGRPDFNHPDWRGYPPGPPLTSQDVADVVAWLTEQRAQFPGQP